MKPNDDERDGQGATAVPESERRRQSQRDLDAHDRMMASRSAAAARDTLHDSTPFAESGSYTVFEARDRAAHTPSIALEIENQSVMAKRTKSIFTDQERYLLDVQRRKDIAELYPTSEEAGWLGERARLANANPDGPEARQIAEEARLAKLYEAPHGDNLQDQNNKKEVPTEVTPEQKERVDAALSKTTLSKEIGGATDVVGGSPAPNDPTPIDKSRDIGQDLQRQGVTVDKDK